MAMGKTGQEVIAAFAKGVAKGKLPNYGVLKTKLNKLIREGEATAADKEALNILKSSDETATIRQKQAQSTSRSKKPVSLAGSPKVGGTQNKSYGGSMGKKTVKKQSGGKIGRGFGAATRGGGAVMK
jgi:hypothetical protein